MNDNHLYARFKHTVGCRVVVGGDEAGADWHELDIYSESDDPKAALEAYLEDEFGEVDAPKGGVWTVSEAGRVPVVRQYRLA